MTTPDLASVSVLEDPVRRRLYEIVSARAEPTGRDQAASAAGIGRPLAAYHLDKLVRSGLLNVTYRRLGGRSGPGAGRPAKLYARSDREFAVSLPPREYELAARILADALANEADKANEAGGTSRAAVRKAAYRKGIELASPGEERGLDQVLSAHGYEPAWSRTSDGTVIRLRNCPFHHLAQCHRDLVCGMNLSFIGGMIAGIPLPDWRAVLDPRPGHCCVAITDQPDAREETQA